MTVHLLKTHPEPFAAVLDGSKIHEFRKDDRNYQVGDYLRLQEYNPATSTFSGRETCRKITYKGTGFGIPEGYCCLSMKPILPPLPGAHEVDIKYKAMVKQLSLDRKRIYREVDGYYVYQQGPDGGFLSPLALRTLAEILDEMNAEWDAQVQADPSIGPTQTAEGP